MKFCCYVNIFYCSYQCLLFCYPGKKPKIVSWSAEEKDAVYTFFAKLIKTRSAAPGKSQCEKAQQEFPILQNRSWSSIKFCVKNIVATLKAGGVVRNSAK